MSRVSLRVRLLAAALLAALAFSLPHSPAGAAAPPEPSARPPRWEFQFEVTHDLRLIQWINLASLLYLQLLKDF